MKRISSRIGMAWLLFAYPVAIAQTQPGLTQPPRATLLSLFAENAGTLAAPQDAAQASPQSSHHHDAQTAKLEANVKEQPGGPALRLEDLEQMALASNPTLVQAAAEIRAAEGRKRQAGLFPNPTVGYTGSEIRGGSFRGGEQGVFVQQNIVLGGKLRLSKSVFEQERKEAETEAEEQKLRVMNGVQILFYQALAAQKMVDLRQQMDKLAQDAVETAHQLANVGQADQPDVLQAEVEADQSEIALDATKQTQLRVWKELAAMVGKPELPLARLDGNLEDPPSVNTDELLQAILRESPSVKIAALNEKRAEAELARARREPVPDLQLRAGLQQDRELSDASGKPVGAIGFVEVGVQIPVFNRNQGSVQAARADLERAQQETRRTELVLRQRSAAVFERYQMARATAEKYKSQTIPRAARAYKLYMSKYYEMAAAYPQVLISQRTLFQVQADYVSALSSLWTSYVALKGFLLTDGLEAPVTPSEAQRPVREINIPTSMPSNP